MKQVPVTLMLKLIAKNRENDYHFLENQLLKIKTRYFSENFQVQGLIFSLIVLEVSLHPREASTSYISTAYLIMQDSRSKYS